MRDELAGRLLDSILVWTQAEQSEWMSDLRRLAEFKYDSYEGFSAGERFFESLARWLAQFESPEQRRTLIDFVRRSLVFASKDEVAHAIATVYPDFVKPQLIEKVAVQLGLPKFAVRAITSSDAFRSLRRRTLYLGLSDGARLDILRRSSPELSHEQFWLSPELGPRSAKSMLGKLGEALEAQTLPGPCTFQHVVFVDDFYGSGTSLLRRENGDWAGKLKKARSHLEEDHSLSLLEEGFDASVVIYMASQQATDHIAAQLATFQPSWKLLVVNQLPPEFPNQDQSLASLCEWFFDDILTDQHKGRAPHGYANAGLPLVLSHNTPNNSISVLWADSEGRGGLERRALFPRYERHHVDRP